MFIIVLPDVVSVGPWFPSLQAQKDVLPHLQEAWLSPEFQKGSLSREMIQQSPTWNFSVQRQEST